MAKKTDNRSYVTLVCTECKTEGRKTSKNRKNTPDRLELNKFCKVCNKHTAHKEKK